MEKQEYIIAFGYGIKEKDFSNMYGDIRVLVAHFKNDGSYYTSTIKSSGGGAAKHYVRFLTEEDAQRYIDEKLGDGYTPFKAKHSRLLKLLDSKYNMYIGGVTTPVGIQPPEYDIDGDLVTSEFDDVVKGISKILNSLIGKEYYYTAGGSAIDKITEFFFSGLDIDTGPYGFNLGHRFYIKNIIPNDDGINVDLNVAVYCPYVNFEETTTQTKISDILHDPDEQVKNLIDSMQNEIKKNRQLQLNIFISYADIKYSLRGRWNGRSNSPRFKPTVVEVIGQEVVNSILHSEPGSANYQNVINLRTEIRDITTKLISIARDYANTEVFIESYKDKNVGSVTAPAGVQLHESLSKSLRNYIIDKSILNTLNELSDKGDYLQMHSSDINKITEFFFSGLDIDIGTDRYFLGYHLHINNTKFDDNGVNIDLKVIFNFSYLNFEETTTEMEISEILDDADEHFKSRIYSVQNEIDKGHELQLNIFIKYTDLKDSISHDVGESIRFRYEIVNLIEQEIWNSILHSKPGSTNYQNVTNFRAEIRGIVTKLISIAKDYANTELFLESYKDKTVQDILHDLYEGKVK